jgi:hypothetical protein
MVSTMLGIANVVLPLTTVMVVRTWESQRPALQPVVR